VDLSDNVARAVAAGVLGLYIVWRATSVLMGREHLGAAGGEVVKEFLAWAVVFAAVTQYAVVDEAVLKGAVESLKGVVDEAYACVVKYEEIPQRVESVFVFCYEFSQAIGASRRLVCLTQRLQLLGHAVARASRCGGGQGPWT